jgi:phosphoribosylpyrophosphate synthetase
VFPFQPVTVIHAAHPKGNGHMHLLQMKFLAAEKTKALRIRTFWPYYCLARIYSAQNKSSLALKYVEGYLEKKDHWPEAFEDKAFDNIRSTPQFKALMKKYFPEQYKE